MHTKTLIIFLLIITPLVIGPVAASEVTITVKNEQVQAAVTLSMHQNMTEFPTRTALSSSAQDPSLATAFSEALRKLNKNATVPQVEIRINSKGSWMNVTGSIIVNGVSNRQGDVLAVDTSWKSFNLTPDIRAGDLSFHQVGKRYLRPIIEFYDNASRFVSRPNASITGVSFFVERTESVSGLTAANRLGNFTLFDFQRFSAPIDQWTRTYSLPNDTTTWKFSPAPVLAASIRVQRLNRTVSLIADYALEAKIVIPGIARASGNTLFVDVGGGRDELIMGIVIAAVISLAVVTQVLIRAKKGGVKKAGR